jgi:hypothetical protein
MSTCATRHYISNPTRQREIPRNKYGAPANLAQTYDHQRKTPGPTVSKNVFDPWTKVAIIPWKQIVRVQGDIKTHMDLRSTVVGKGIKLQHRKHGKISIQIPKDHY